MNVLDFNTQCDYNTKLVICCEYYNVYIVNSYLLAWQPHCDKLLLFVYINV